MVAIKTYFSLIVNTSRPLLWNPCFNFFLLQFPLWNMIDKKFAVQMVDLVLNDLCLEIFEFHGHLLSGGRNEAGNEFFRPGDRPPFSGQTQTALGFGLGFL